MPRENECEEIEGLAAVLELLSSAVEHFLLVRERGTRLAEHQAIARLKDVLREVRTQAAFIRHE